MVHTNPESLWDYPAPDTTNTINLNSDQGLSEGDTIDGYLDTHLADNTRIEIEPGTYNWQGGGIGGSYADAEIVGTGDPGQGNVEFALESTGDDAYTATNCTGGTFRFKNLTFSGKRSGDNNKMRVEAETETAEMVLEHVWLPDGQDPNTGSGDTNGIYSGSSDHIGTLRILWCHIEGFGDNGCYTDGYAGDGLGQVIIVGGLYKDNNISNIRVGNDDSVVYRAVSEHSGSLQVPDSRSVNRRGIRIRQPGTGIHIYDSDSYQAVSDWNPVEIHDEAEGGTGEFDDLRVYNESSWSAIREKGNGADGYSGGDVDITGSGDHTVEGFTPSDLCQGTSCDMAKDNTDAWFNLDDSAGSTTSGDTWERRYKDYIEDWETNNPLDLWEEGSDGSGKTAFSIVESPVFEGSQALKVAGNEPQFGYIAAPGGSDFYNLPNTQEDFEFRFYAEGTDSVSGIRVGFGSDRTDPFSHYYRLQVHEYEIEIDRFEDGNVVEQLAVIDYDFDLDGWNRVEVRQDGDGFRVLGYDADGTEIANERVDDTTYGGDGMVLGVVGQNAYTHYIDGIRNLESDPDELVDNFDDADIDEYTVQSGASGDWELETSPTSEASYSLHWDHTSDGNTSEITSQSGLDNYPQTGDTFGFSIYTFEDCTAKMLFGVEDGTPGNRWEMVFDRTQSPSQVEINNAKASSSDSKSVDFSFEQEIWIDVVVEWRGQDTLQIDVIGDDESVSFTYDDTSGNVPSGTGIGWNVTASTATDARWNFDEVFVSGTLIGGGGILSNQGAWTTDSSGVVQTRGDS